MKINNSRVYGSYEFHGGVVRLTEDGVAHWDGDGPQPSPDALRQSFHDEIENRRATTVLMRAQATLIRASR